MKLRAISACMGVVLMAFAAAPAADATSSPDTSEVRALERAGVSWVTYAANGNAPKACRLQVEPSVGGVSCDQLPSYFEPIYCPVTPADADDSLWRAPAELIKKASVNGSKGTIVYRASRKKSKLSARATFSKVGGKWRIVSIRSGGQRLSPPGLIFTEGQKLRKKLWPAHC